MLTVLEKVDVLHTAEIFREVPTESLARIAAAAQEVNLAVRELLSAENNAAESMFLLLEGEVGLVRSGHDLGVARELQVVGALPLLADRPSPETARTIRPTRALRIRQSDLFEIMSEDFAVTRGILRALVDKSGQVRVSLNTKNGTL